MDVLRSPLTNKSMAWLPEERKALGLRGLLPAGEAKTLQQQVELAIASVRRIAAPLAKYEHLITLLDRDARLFFALMRAYTSELMPIVYTPVVGEACVQWSNLLIPARGLYISLEDAGNVRALLRNWPAKTVRAIVVTDGGRILGLGDLGSNGMGIPVGKLALYTALAGVDPAVTLPVSLDVGTDNEALLADPAYTGLRRKRESGPAYYALVDEFVAAVKETYGGSTLVQWEDFGNSSAFAILDKYKQVLPSFNDDIEGTASVVVAGLMSACRHVPGVPRLEKGTYLFYGAGEAGVGIADLLAYSISLASGGKLSVEDGRKRIWLVDSRGLVTAERAAAEGAGFAEHKRHYAHPAAWLDLSAYSPRSASASPAASPTPDGLPRDLASIVSLVRPTALMGVSAQPQAFTQDVIEAMVASCDGRWHVAAGDAPAASPVASSSPVVFALSNPTSKAECTAEQAYTWSKGRVVFASGSPFDPVTIAMPFGGQRTFVPGQGNNAYIFPALGLATLAVDMRQVPQHSMYVAASTLADAVSEAAVRETGCLYPPLSEIQEVSHRIATAVALDAYACGIAGLAPQPADMGAHIRQSMWNPSY